MRQRAAEPRARLADGRGPQARAGTAPAETLRESDAGRGGEDRQKLLRREPAGVPQGIPVSSLTRLLAENKGARLSFYGQGRYGRCQGGGAVGTVDHGQTDSLDDSRASVVPRL